MWTSVHACTVLCASVHPHSAKSHSHVRKSSPLPPSAGFVVTMRFRRQMCTTAPWMGRATSTGALCSPLSTSHPSRSWSSGRRWAGHHCLYSSLCWEILVVGYMCFLVCCRVCVHPDLLAISCTGSYYLISHMTIHKFDSASLIVFGIFCTPTVTGC